MNPVLPYLDSGYSQKIQRPPDIRLDANDPRPRLNVVLPNYYRHFAFGGITSAMELVWALSVHYPEIRFLSQAPLGAAEEMFPFADYVAPPAAMTAASLQDGPLRCRRGDIFLCTHHATVKVWEGHARAMAAAGLSPSAFYYFLQDYEPGFAPWGYQHCCAAATYGHAAHIRAIFNSRELQAYFHQQGLTFAAEHVLLPSLHPDIQALLTAQGWRLRPKAPGRLVVLCYGRPGSPRNCFEALAEGLYLHFSQVAAAEGGGVVLFSAGRPHEDLVLCPGVVLRSLGKLDMAQYIALLEHAHVGISLMASPHPSYPPLEMATMGLHTITNAYASKDLSTVHPNITSIAAPLPELLAAALPGVMAQARAMAGQPHKARLPTNMSPLPWRENVRQAAIPAIVPA